MEENLIGRQNMKIFNQRINLIPCIIAFTMNMLYLNKFTDNFLIKSSSLLFLAWGIMFYSNGNLTSIYALFRKPFLITIILFSILSVGVLRTNNEQATVLSGISSSINLLLFMILVVVFSQKYLQVNGLVKAESIFYYIIILPITIYCTINFLLWATNVNVSDVESTNIGQAMLLSKFGINMSRVKFPLASGINSFGTVIGAALSIAVPYFAYTKRNNIVGILSITLMSVIILMTDSRSALLYPFFIFIIFKLFYSKKFLNKLLSIIPYLPIVGPFILLGTLQLIASSDAMSYFVRSDTDLENGNSRVLIWSAAVLEFIQVKLIHLIGYGDYGHVASGASAQWSALFELWDNSETMHPHNSTLAILFDYGYIGLLVYIICLKKITNIFRKFYQSKLLSISSILILSFILYSTLIGLSESFFGFYYLNSLQLFFAVIIIGLSIDQTHRSYDRSNKVIPVQNPSSRRAPIERSPVYPSLVPLPARREKQGLPSENS